MGRAWRALAGVLALGCASKAATTTPDGGGDAPLAGRRSFDVVASLTPAPTMMGPTSAIPSTSTFTLRLDADAKQLVVGGSGRGTVLPVTTADGKTFTTTAGFPIGVPASGSTGVEGLSFDALSFTVAGDSLRAYTTGSASISCGDCDFSVAFSAELYGSPDITSPFLAGSAALSLDPFNEFYVSASEPLALSSVARLVGGDGTSVALTPEPDTTNTFLVGFSKPNVVLGVGGAYAVALDGLVDLAGLKGRQGDLLRLGSYASPPLVPADGFESVTGATEGGAVVVTAGLLTPLAGARSVYIGASSSPGQAQLGQTSKFIVRLAVPPGATSLRFSYQQVSFMDGEGFVGSVGVGSPGKTPSDPANGFAAPTTSTELTWASGPVYVSDTKTMTLPLPADAAGEVIVAIVANDNPGGGLLRPGGLVVDDLRLE